MSLLAGIDSWLGDKTIALAAQVVADRLESMPPPRSLCELRLNDSDYQWLRNWAIRLTSQRAVSWLNGFGNTETAGKLPLRRVEAIGCLLLLLAAETARREAREGYLWSAIQGIEQRQFEPATGHLLFSQGQPTPLYKDAVEAAARRLKLRHVFGIDGTQKYYVTVYLQFGFTRRGMAQLPLWLAGHSPSEAVQHLLSSRYESPSFRQLWDALREYRRNNIPERRLRLVAGESPWILPQWIDELVQRARERLDLGTVSGREVSPDGHQPLPFLEGPWLQWDLQAPPRFICRLINLATLDLTAERYALVGEGAACATLLRRPDGSYAYPEWIELSTKFGQQIVTLVDDTGHAPVVAANQVVDLWNLAEDITVYDLSTGQRVADVWQERLSIQRSYALLVSADLEIRPPAHIWYRVGDSKRRLAFLQSGWSSGLQVLLDGEVIWAPLLGSAPRQPPTDPSWAKHVNLTRIDKPVIGLNQSVQPSIVRIPEGVQVTFVRLHAQPLNFTQTATEVEIEPVEVTPTLAVADLEFTIGLRRGHEHARVRRSLPVDVAGVARLGISGWETVEFGAMMSVEEGRSTVYRLFLPRHWQAEAFGDLALFEGTTFLTRLWRRPRPLGALAGYGAPLCVTDRAYNATKVVLRIADSVTHPGLVHEVQRSAPSAVHLYLTRPVDPDPEHQIIRWPGAGQMQILPPRSFQRVGPNVWRIEHFHYAPEEAILAVAYQGEWLGTWCPWPFFSDASLPTASVQSPLMTAALIRWLHLPVLAPTCFPTVRAFVYRYPEATLAAWLLDKGLPQGLSFSAASEEWLAVVRQVFWDWNPTPEQAGMIVGAIASDSADRPLAAVARAFWFDPMLLGRVIRAWRKNLRTPEAQIRLARQVRALRCEIAGLPTNASEEKLNRYQTQLFEQTAREMQVHENFLEWTIIKGASARGSPSPIDVTNLRIALGMAPFRQYLALRVLGDTA